MRRKAVANAALPPVSGLVLLFVAACGGSETAADVDLPLGGRDNTAEVEEYYRTTPALPPAVREDVEQGAIDQQEIERRAAAGEFPRFFQEASLEDLPQDLVWEDGMELPDLGSADAKQGGTLFMQIPDFPRTLRVLGPDANGAFRGYLWDEMMIPFSDRHPNVTGLGPTGFHHYPGVAREWAVDREAKTVYVRLDPEARWTDGHPVTTEDVFFMFFFYQSSYIRAPWYNNFYTRNFARVTRYDDLTFSITLPEAKPDMKSRVLELTPIPRHFFMDLGDDFVERYQWRFMPTTGAYTIAPDDIRKGRSITLTRVDDWWADERKFLRNRFNPDRIHFTVIRDKAKAFESFKKGEIDTVRMRESEYWDDKLPDADPLVRKGYIHKHQFYNDIPRPTWGLYINTARPLLSDRRVRVGVQYATNWDLVIDKYFRGDYRRMRTTADGYGVFTHPTIEPRPYSVDKALEHFAKAGFTKRGSDGILVNDRGQRLSFTLSTGYESLRDILTILREQAARAGLEYRLEVLDSTAAWKKVQEKKHDISFSAFNTSAEMYPRYWETYHSVNAYDRPFLEDGSVNPDRSLKTQTNNLHSFADPELDRLIERYRASEDAEEMIELAHRMEEILHREAVFVPGFVMPFLRMASWRWIGWPEDFNVKLARHYEEFWVHWVDGEKKEETLAAKRSGKTFPPVVAVHDQYNAFD